MLKAKARTASGPLYIFGLSDRNVELLIQGDPIAFDGREVGAPAGHRFLIACVETAADLKRHHDHFAAEGLHTHTIGVSRAVLRGLKREPATLPGAQMKLDGDVFLFAGDTEGDMAKALDFHIPEPVSGCRDELDPVTGHVRRVPVEAAS
jgi:hypothetical protein